MIKFGFLHDYMKGKAAAAEEDRTTKTTVEPVTTETEEASEAPIRPGSRRPAAPRPVEDADADKLIEREVGAKLARDKKEAERLDEAIEENEKQLALLLENMTDEERKDPGVQKLIDRLVYEGQKLRKKRADNPAPMKKDEAESKPKPKEPVKKAPKAETKTEAKTEAEAKTTESTTESEGSAPAATKKAPKAETKTEAKTKAEAKTTESTAESEESAPASVKILSSNGVWAVDKQTLSFREASGEFFLAGESSTYALYKKGGVDPSRIKRFASSITDVDVAGKPEVLPAGEVLYTFEERLADYRESKLPAIPDLQDTVVALAAAGMVEFKTIGSMRYYYHVPVVRHSYTNFAGETLTEYWAIPPEIWALGVRKLSKILGDGYDVAECDVVMTDDDVVVKVTYDGKENIGDLFC